MIVKREDFTMERSASGLSMKVNGETLAVEITTDAALDETDLRWILYAAGPCALRYIAAAEETPDPPEGQLL